MDAKTWELFYSLLSPEQRVQHMQILAKSMGNGSYSHVSTPEPMFLQQQQLSVDTPWNNMNAIVKAPIVTTSVATPPTTIVASTHVHKAAQKPFDFGPFYDKDENKYFKVCTNQKCSCKVFPPTNEEESEKRPR